MTVIDLSIARRHCSSTCGTLVFTNRIRRLLQRHEGWRRGSAESDDGWNRYQDAPQSELYLWYGAENDLTAWHALCRAIGVEPLPQTCEQCEEVGDRATKLGRFMLTRVIGFPSVAELRSYTKETRKIF